jgi:hypothetical protein
MNMKTILSFVLLFCLNALNQKARAQEMQEIDRSAFYKSMATNKKSAVESELKVLQTADIPGKEAFIGALTMRQAGLGGDPARKLKLFKSGHSKLEAAIKKDQENAEYRFLRLLVQENAPGFLGYKRDLKADSEYIRKSYKNLPESLQQAIFDYSKISKILKPGDF